MRKNLFILSSARIIGAVLPIRNAVTACAEIEGRVIKSFKIHSSGQHVVVVDRRSIEVRTSGSLHPDDIEGDVGFSCPLVDTPSLAD